MLSPLTKEAVASLKYNDHFKQVVAHIETQKIAATEQLLNASPDTVMVCQGRVQSLTAILKDLTA